MTVMRFLDILTYERRQKNDSKNTWRSFYYDFKLCAWGLLFF